MFRLDITRMKLDDQRDYLKTCIMLLPDVKNRIISAEDYEVFNELKKQKELKPFLKDVSKRSKLDLMCCDHDILDITCQFLNLLLDRMNKEYMSN